MNEYHYYNEPGFEQRKDGKNEIAAKDYNNLIDHKNLRVAVNETVAGVLSGNVCLPKEMVKHIIKQFHVNYDGFLKRAESLVQFDGQVMRVSSVSPEFRTC